MVVKNESYEGDRGVKLYNQDKLTRAKVLGGRAVLRPLKVLPSKAVACFHLLEPRGKPLGASSHPTVQPLASRRSVRRWADVAGRKSIGRKSTGGKSDGLLHVPQPKLSLPMDVVTPSLRQDSFA